MRVHWWGNLKSPELVVLGALSLLTRFWDLFDPRVVVWDEVHFQRFAAAYLGGNYYVDVHPPVAKMLLAGAGWLFGVTAETLAANESAPAMRLLPALAGALIIPAVYLILRELGAGRRVATLGAALLLVDNALLAESRFVLTDSLLILFGMTAVLLYLAARRRAGAARWICLAAAAAAAGLAAGTKWTGLSALGLILLSWGVELFRHRRPASIVAREAAVLLALPAAVYAGAFALHFALLRHASAFVDVHRTMMAINIGWATDSNAGASPWYTWPIAKHSIGFWSAPGPGGASERWIVLLANPVVWWGTLFGVAAVVIAALGRRAALARHRAVLLFLATGYVLNFVPFAFIRRPMYLYHYFFALIFSLMFAAVGVGALAGWMDDERAPPWRFASRRSAALYSAIIGLAVSMFLYLAPMTYGWPLSARAVVHRRWVVERHGA
jgi:dolichyl-phosphate-mannose-protein mannosyltransferase